MMSINGIHKMFVGRMIKENLRVMQALTLAEDAKTIDETSKYLELARRGSGRVQRYIYEHLKTKYDI